MGNVIVVKNVDKNLYRRLKSAASLKGYTIGEALNEAIKLWLMLNEAISRDYLDYLTCRERSEEKLKEVYEKYCKKHKGKYVVVCDGIFTGIFDNEKKALNSVCKSKARECIVAKLGELIKEEKVEFGMGVL